MWKQREDRLNVTQEPGVKTERRQVKCNHNGVKSASRTMSMRAAAPSKATTASDRLEKQPCPLRSVQFENALTFLNSFNVIRTLCLPSHTSLHMHDWPSQKHVPRLLTVIHTLLVQRPWRCAWGIHCEYIHLVCAKYSLSVMLSCVMMDLGLSWWLANFYLQLSIPV